MPASSPVARRATSIVRNRATTSDILRLPPMHHEVLLPPSVRWSTLLGAVDEQELLLVHRGDRFPRSRSVEPDGLGGRALGNVGVRDEPL
jgi:hypothetical protein